MQSDDCTDFIIDDNMKLLHLLKVSVLDVLSLWTFLLSLLTTSELVTARLTLSTLIHLL